MSYGGRNWRSRGWRKPKDLDVTYEDVVKLIASQGYVLRYEIGKAFDLTDKEVTKLLRAAKRQGLIEVYPGAKTWCLTDAGTEKFGRGY